MGGAKDDNNDSGGIYRSDDKGKTWKRIQTFMGPFPFYFGQIRVDPNDDQQLYHLDVGFRVSSNGGKEFQSSNGGHSDHHSLWINPYDSNHLILGNDGGLFISKDKAKNWTRHSHLAHRAVLRHRRGHEQAVPRLRRSARQRQLGRSQRHRQRPRHRPERLAHRQRRRRILLPG